MRMRLTAIMLFTVILSGCGDDDTTNDVDPCAATAANELCVMVQVPADAPAVPQQVSIHFFNSLPAMGPPAFFGPELKDAADLEQYQPGATFPVIISGLPDSGEMFIYGALYMEGGGAANWQPVPNVDFHTGYPETPITFTGAPIILDTPLTFSVFSQP